MTIRQRLEVAFDLWEAGVEVRRQSLVREFPGATDTEIDERLNRWLAQRPGAERGDGPQPADSD